MDTNEQLKQAKTLFEQKRYEECLQALQSLPQEETETQILLADYHDLFLQYEIAFRLYTQAAQRGEAYAMYKVAKYIFYQYDGADRDIKKGQKMLLDAAQKGYLQAMSDLADYYTRGEYEFPKNEELSVHWLTKAAEQGSADCMCKLGRRYAFGQYVEKDFAKALYWLNAALKAGDAHAKHWIKYVEKQTDDKK